MDAEKCVIAFVISGTHQHSYNHVALGSPPRTPKNGKKTRWRGKWFHSVNQAAIQATIWKQKLNLPKKLVYLGGLYWLFQLS